MGNNNIITLKDIIDFVENESWFQWEEGDEMFASREYGDVGEEIYSIVDLAEAHRLADLIREKFTVDTFVDVVDEWVTIEIV